MTTNDVIVVKNLTKNFGDFTAVDDISFKVKKGEVFGFLGPNGAGKTTTINMLATLLNPSSGEASVNGFDIYTERDEVRKSIGIVFQTPALDENLTGRENLQFHSMLYGLKKDERGERIEEVLKLVELFDKADALVENYSGGMKRRLEIARGLIQNPKVLFLDEPTLGLDAQTRRKIWEYIKELNEKEGSSVILTTHYMDEADYLCDYINIIDKGEIIVQGEPESLKKKLKGDVVRLELEGGKEEFLKECEEKAWIKEVKEGEGVINLTVEDGENKIPELVKLAEESGLVMNSVNLRKPSLEDVFLHYTGREIREEEVNNNMLNKIKKRHGRRGH